MCDICWIGRRELWFLYRIRRGGVAFLPPVLSFRQLWTQEWQKAAAPLTIKPRAEPLIVPARTGNYFHPGPPLGTGDEERRGDSTVGGGQEGMWGMDKMAVLMARCGQILAQPSEGVGGRLRSLPLSQLLQKPKDLRLKLGHDWNWGAVYGFWMLHVGFYFSAACFYI